MHVNQCQKANYTIPLYKTSLYVYIIRLNYEDNAMYIIQLLFTHVKAIFIGIFAGV